MRTRALWLQSGLAAAIGVGVVVQVYLIAAYIFHAGSGALSAHKAVGYVVFALEVLTFLVGIPAWRGNRRALGLSLALPVVGAIQIAFASGTAWVGALHGAGAIAVLLLAGAVHVMSMREAKRQAPQ
jgi:hypothetical protein